MDEDIRYIIEEERKLAAMLETAVSSARARVDEHRSAVSVEKDSEFSKISSEYGIMTEQKREEMKNQMDSELDRLRSEQENLFNNAGLLNKITGRIISLILENRQ